MNKREQQKAATHSEIIEAAEELFSTHGYENTSVQDIADKCGMTKGALYHHFESKEDLLEHICAAHYDLLLSAALPIISDVSSGWLERFKKVIGVMRGIGLEKKSFVSEYLSIRENSDNHILKDRLQKYDRNLYRETIAPLLDEAQEQGECRFETPAKLMAVFIHQLDLAVTDEINRILHMNNNENSEDEIRTILEGFISTLAAMLGVEKKLIKEIVNPDEAILFFREIIKNRGEL